ncbi:MAG: polysaccharide deacetylase family protein [Desulfobacterales bacterium]|nr:polysaccharide deacetylase family protein [Desulfobacterales bacterium]
MDERVRGRVMIYTASPFWSAPPDHLESRLARCVDEAADGRESGKPVYIFFRADDIGAPGRRFTRLMEIFTRQGAPLCPAIVPTWLTAARWKTIKSLALGAPSLWCWHQHGWRHVNHETRGKKQEFGPARSTEDIRSDLHRGRVRLETLMGGNFYPGFTPPWNRCGAEALRLLHELGYAAISRSKGASPAAPASLPDIRINVDLHTRKEPDPEEAWRNIFAELKRAAAAGLIGVMIHHQRMNDAAFDFLELLIRELTRPRDFHPVTLKDLAELHAGNEKSINR